MFNLSILVVLNKECNNFLKIWCSRSICTVYIWLYRTSDPGFYILYSQSKCISSHTMHLTQYIYSCYPRIAIRVLSLQYRKITLSNKKPICCRSALFENSINKDYTFIKCSVKNVHSMCLPVSPKRDFQSLQANLFAKTKMFAKPI